jgi:hypothetical protein
LGDVFLSCQITWAGFTSLASLSAWLLDAFTHESGWHPKVSKNIEPDDFGGTIENWNADKHEAWKIAHDFYREKVRTENITRRVIAFSIIGVFVILSIAGGIYGMFFQGNIQVVITVSAFISGPLGVVIGYYFGQGEDRKR